MLEKFNISSVDYNLVTRLVIGMKVLLIDTHVAPRSRSFANVTVRHFDGTFQKMAVLGGISVSETQLVQSATSTFTSLWCITLSAYSNFHTFR